MILAGTYEYLTLVIKVILFDLDDLMVNSTHLHIEASRRVFSRFGIDITTMPHEMVVDYFGKRVAEIIKITADHFKMKDVDLEELAREREEVFLEIVRSELEAMPGLFKLVETLRHEPFKRAVASSGTKVYIREALKKLGLTDFFDEIVAGDMVEHGKPSPDIFLKAAEVMGVCPSECVVIEDSTAGVEAAKKAGMRCVGVVNSVSPYKQDLSSADVVVNRLDEIRVEYLTKLKIKDQKSKTHIKNSKI